MTLDDLIEELEAAREDMGGQTEVRVAYQENWPLRGSIEAVTIPDADQCPWCADSEEHDEDGTCPEQGHTSSRVSDNEMLWLAIGNAPYEESGYAPRWAWRS